MSRLVTSFREHPVLTIIVSTWIAVTLASGILHELEIAGDVLLVLVRHTKEQLHSVSETFSELWREWREWS